MLKSVCTHCVLRRATVTSLEGHQDTRLLDSQAWCGEAVLWQTQSVFRIWLAWAQSQALGAGVRSTKRRSEGKQLVWNEEDGQALVEKADQGQGDSEQMQKDKNKGGKIKTPKLGDTRERSSLFRLALLRPHKHHLTLSNNRAVPLTLLRLRVSSSVSPGIVGQKAS